MAAQICLLSALNKLCAHSLKEEEAHEKQRPHQLVLVVVVSSAELKREFAFSLFPRDFTREEKKKQRESAERSLRSGLRPRNESDYDETITLDDDETNNESNSRNCRDWVTLPLGVFEILDRVPSSRRRPSEEGIGRRRRGKADSDEKTSKKKAEKATRKKEDEHGRGRRDGGGGEQPVVVGKFFVFLVFFRRRFVLFLGVLLRRGRRDVFRVGERRRSRRRGDESAETVSSDDTAVSLY